MSVACVFFPGDDGGGRCAQECQCHRLYGDGDGDFRKFGYENPQEYEARGRKPRWGCEWFEQWKKNIEEAVKRGQTLIVYYFAGQAGMGEMKWRNSMGKMEETFPFPHSHQKLWDGVGLGVSQKAEVAYLKSKGYSFEKRDVMDFLDHHVQDVVRVSSVAFDMFNANHKNPVQL